MIIILVGCSSATNAEITQVSPSATPTLMPAYTITPTPSSTPTTIPTLSAEDARKRLLELLATNGGCQLPCMWGTTPGKSGNQEARNVLLSLSSIAPPETIFLEPTPLRGVLGGTITLDLWRK